MTKAIKIGMIQLRGAGDCLIALPIAKWLHNKGMKVYWAIDHKFYDAFKYAAPYVNFISVSVDEKTIQSNIRNPYWFETPRQMLIDAGCDEVISFPYEETLHYEKIGLDSRLIDPVAIRAKDLKLAFCNTFDQFKYAVCNVPFKEKWNVDIRRNMDREEKLFNNVVKDKTKPYVITHLDGAMGRIVYNIDVENFLKTIGLENYQVIKITPITDNVFDWTTTLERCNLFIGIDSFYVNLIDQLQMNIPTKYFLRRSPTNFTPVLGTLWDYLPIDLASDRPHELKF